MQTRPAEYYAARYFPNLDEAEALIERWRVGAITNRDELDAVWVWASEHIHRMARKYYGRSQNTSRKYWYQQHRNHDEHDAHHARVVRFLEMLGDPKYTHRNAVWIIAAHRRRFAQIEALEQLSSIGIAMTDWGTPLHEQSSPVIHWVYMSKLERNILDRGEELNHATLRAEWERIEERYNRDLTEYRWSNFLKRHAWYTELKAMTFFRKPYRDENDIPPEDYTA